MRGADPHLRGPVPVAVLHCQNLAVAKARITEEIVALSLCRVEVEGAVSAERLVHNVGDDLALFGGGFPLRI